MPAGRFWEKEELMYLVENYDLVGSAACAEHLARTEAAVTHKACRVGAKRKGLGRRSRLLLKDGYLWVSSYEEEYPVHRRMVSQMLGRELTPEEIVHHIDGNCLNNAPDNLELTSRGEHQRTFHREDLELRRDKQTGRLCRVMR